MKIRTTTNISLVILLLILAFSSTGQSFQNFAMPGCPTQTVDEHCNSGMLECPGNPELIQKQDKQHTSGCDHVSLCCSETEQPLSYTIAPTPNNLTLSLASFPDNGFIVARSSSYSSLKDTLPPLPHHVAIFTLHCSFLIWSSTIPLEISRYWLYNSQILWCFISFAIPDWVAAKPTFQLCFEEKLLQRFAVSR